MTVKLTLPPVHVICSTHGARWVPPIAPVGPTFTRPELKVIKRLNWTEALYRSSPDCDHYVTYGTGGGVRCIRCAGWYCA